MYRYCWPGAGQRYAVEIPCGSVATTPTFALLATSSRACVAWRGGRAAAARAGAAARAAAFVRARGGACAHVADLRDTASGDR